MMDCKELIEWLRLTVEHGDENPNEYCTNRCGGCEVCDQAVEAIETLLAERDAAVEALSDRPHYSTCKYGEKCDYVSVITGFPDCYSCNEWEWRGPKKGDDGIRG